MSHTVQYTISALSGAYALKYSVVLHHADRFEALFARFGIDALAGFAADAPERTYEPYDTFQLLMKILKKFAKHGKAPFCTSIVRESDGVEAAVFDDADERGNFELRAYGKTGICHREGAEDVPFDTIIGQKGTYRAVTDTLLGVFKDDIMSLLNLCEETIAKDAAIIAKTVPDSTPIPARLVQT